MWLDNVLSWLGIRAASPENPATPLSNPDRWLLNSFGGSSAAGVVVNERTAMASSAVFACVQLNAGMVASLPLKIYQDKPDGSGRSVAKSHPLYFVLHDEPNTYMTSYAWRELVMVNCQLNGNHYSIIDRNGAGRAVGLSPVQPHMVRPYMDRGRIVYEVRTADGYILVDQEDMLHIPGLGFDGVQGMSVIGTVGSNPIGTALALEKYVGALHRNSARPSGVLEVPSRISKEGLDALKGAFNSANSGAENGGKTLFIDAGTKWTPMSITPADMETLDSRRYQTTDICRIFGVPPHMIGETDKATSWGSGIEQMTLGYLRFGLEKWLSRIEHELQRKLFSGTRFYAEFDREAVLAMDARTQAEVFASNIQNGLLMPNEARRKMNRPDVDGGDQLFIASNLAPLKSIGATNAAPPNPAPVQ